MHLSLPQPDGPDLRPDVDPGAWTAESATLVGDVRVGAGSSVWYSAVLRAEYEPDHRRRAHQPAGRRRRARRPGLPGDDRRRRLGRARRGAARLHGRGRRAWSACSATVLNGAVIGRGSLVAAGAVVLEGTVVPPGSLVAGVPAKVRRPTHAGGARGPPPQRRRLRRARRSSTRPRPRSLTGAGEPEEQPRAALPQRRRRPAQAPHPAPPARRRALLRGADGGGGLLLRLQPALPPRRALGAGRRPAVGAAGPDARRRTRRSCPATTGCTTCSPARTGRRWTPSPAGAWCSATPTCGSPTSSAGETSPLYRNAVGDECVYVEAGHGDGRDGVRPARGAPGRLRGAAARDDAPLGPDRGRAAAAYAIEANSHIGPPKRYLSRYGQFLEHAPYCERDLRGRRPARGRRGDRRRGLRQAPRRRPGG